MLKNLRKRYRCKECREWFHHEKEIERISYLHEIPSNIGEWRTSDGICFGCWHNDAILVLPPEQTEEEMIAQHQEYMAWWNSMSDETKKAQLPF